MKNSMTYKGFAGTVEYSAADKCLFGRLSGIDDIVSYEGQSVEEIRQAFQEAVDDYLADCVAIGRQPSRPYSGKFVLRLGHALHASLAAKAVMIMSVLTLYAKSA